MSGIVSLWGPMEFTDYWNSNTFVIPIYEWWVCLHEVTSVYRHACHAWSIPLTEDRLDGKIESPPPFHYGVERLHHMNLSSDSPIKKFDGMAIITHTWILHVPRIPLESWILHWYCKSKYSTGYRLLCQSNKGFNVTGSCRTHRIFFDSPCIFVIEIHLYRLQCSRLWLVWTPLNVGCKYRFNLCWTTSIKQLKEIKTLHTVLVFQRKSCLCNYFLSHFVKRSPSPLGLWGNSWLSIMGFPSRLSWISP